MSDLNNEGSVDQQRAGMLRRMKEISDKEAFDNRPTTINPEVVTGYEIMTCLNCDCYGSWMDHFRGECSHCEKMVCNECSIHDEFTEDIFCHVCIEKYDLKVKDMDADEEDDEDEDDEEEEPKEDEKKEEPKPVVTVIIKRKKQLKP
jgi:hypothetical protein